MRREYNIILVREQEYELDYESLGLQPPDEEYIEELALICIDLSKVEYFYEFKETFKGKSVEATVACINGRLTPTLLVSYKEFKEHLENESNHTSIKT